MNVPNSETLRKVAEYTKENDVESIVDHVAGDEVVVWDWCGESTMWKTARDLAKILDRNITWDGYRPRTHLHLSEKTWD